MALPRPNAQPLHIAYATQNVGNIDFSTDTGDTVPVKQSLLGLQRAGHRVSCLMLAGREVRRIENVADAGRSEALPTGLSGSAPFLAVESGVRRLQRETRLPYFAAFDSYRFYEACLRALPGFDLCHEHNGAFCVGAALACRRLGMPYVLTVSADPIFEKRMIGRPLRGLHGYVAAREAAFTYRLARRILCVSEAAKQNLAQSWALPPDKIVVMANGVDTQLFSPAYDPAPMRAEWGLGDRPVVAFVGAFQPWHGLDKLIESMALVRQETPDALLLLVGDGRARPQVDQAIAAHNMQQQVIVTGLLPQEKIPALLAAADVATLPYPQLPAELWFSPLKLYEYMAAGKAIVASDAGQIGDVIRDGENGLLVRPGDVGELAGAITRLLRDGALRERIGRTAREQAVAQHSWERYVSRLESVYRQVLGLHPVSGKMQKIFPET